MGHATPGLNCGAGRADRHVRLWCIPTMFPLFIDSLVDFSATSIAGVNQGFIAAMVTSLKERPQPFQRTTQNQPEGQQRVGIGDLSWLERIVRRWSRPLSFASPPAIPSGPALAVNSKYR